MQHDEDSELNTDATDDQLAELRRLGVAEKDLEGLSSDDAEDWIDELRTERIDDQKFGRKGS